MDKRNGGGFKAADVMRMMGLSGDGVVKPKDLPRGLKPKTSPNWETPVTEVRVTSRHRNWYRSQYRGYWKAQQSLKVRQATPVELEFGGDPNAKAPYNPPIINGRLCQ